MTTATIERPLMSLAGSDLIPKILAGDPDAIAEGEKRKSKAVQAALKGETVTVTETVHVDLTEAQRAKCTRYAVKAADKATNGDRGKGSGWRIAMKAAYREKALTFAG